MEDGLKWLCMDMDESVLNTYSVSVSALSGSLMIRP